MKKFFSVGMRTAKTALCVLICLLIYEVFSAVDISSLEQSRFITVLRSSLLEGSPSFACIAAVISLQDSMEETASMGISRIIGSLVGGAFAMAFAFLNSFTKGKTYILFAVAGVIIITCLCNYFKKSRAVSISVITFLIIFTGIDMSKPYIFAVNRITGTVIGVSTAFLVNRYISPPKK